MLFRSVGSWPVLSVEPEGVRSLESLREPANQVRGNRVIIAVRGVRRHATNPKATLSFIEFQNFDKHLVHQFRLEAICELN